MLRHTSVLLEELLRLRELQKNIFFKTSFWSGAVQLSQVGDCALKEVAQRSFGNFEFLLLGA